MNYKKIIFIAAFALILTAGTSWAQEVKSNLISRPNIVNISVEEGKKAKADFTLDNKSGGRWAFDTYKDRSRKSHFTGAPWLIVFPSSDTLNPNTSKKITLRADAKNLKPGSYDTEVLFSGTSDEIPVAVPVRVIVKPAPVIRVVKVEIDDSPPDANIEPNHVINPGETAFITLYIENAGSLPANDLTLRLASEDPSLSIFDETASVPSLGAGDEASVVFSVAVGEDGHPSIPPVATLTTTDKKGRTWEDNFYLGEEGQFDYPMGTQ